MRCGDCHYLRLFDVVPGASYREGGGCCCVNPPTINPVTGKTARPMVNMADPGCSAWRLSDAAEAGQRG